MLVQCAGRDGPARSACRLSAGSFDACETCASPPSTSACPWAPTPSYGSGTPPPTDDETTQRDHAVSGTSRSGRHSSRLLSGDAGPTPVGRRGGKDTLGQRRRGHPGRRREEVAGELPGERPEKVVIRRQEAWSLRGTSIRILQGSAQRNVVRRHADHHQHMRTRSPAPPGPQALQSAQEELADEARNGTPVQKRQPPAASRVPSPGSDVRSLEPTLRLSRLLRGRTAC